jgi:hypothetical protein
LQQVPEVDQVVIVVNILINAYVVVFRLGLAVRTGTRWPNFPSGNIRGMHLLRFAKTAHGYICINPTPVLINQGKGFIKTRV